MRRVLEWFVRTGPYKATIAAAALCWATPVMLMLTLSSAPMWLLMTLAGVSAAGGQITLDSLLRYRRKRRLDALADREQRQLAVLRAIPLPAPERGRVRAIIVPVKHNFVSFPIGGHIPGCALERGADCDCDAIVGGG